MLDKTFIHRKIEFIQQDLLRIEEFKDKTFDEIAKDWRSFAIVKNLLMEIIGRGIDINQHILAEKFKPAISAPLDYTETFLKLSDLGVLTEDFTKEIAKSAGFRNAIVHGYNRIDKSVVFQTVGVAIEQYTKYCGYILQFLEKETESSQNYSAGFTFIEILVVIAVLIITAAGGVVVWEKKTTPKQELAPTPTSIPTFVPETTLSPKPTSISKNGCIIWGCNGELCIDEDSERIATTCVERSWHKCLRTATCERQTDGRCAWTQTPELKDCLNKFKN